MGTLPTQARVEFVADAPIDAGWALVADVTRTGEWSHECVSSEWLDGATAAEPGARFRGRNKQGRNRWSRVCEVLDVDRPTRFAFTTVPTAIYRDQTRWSFELEAVGPDRTRIVESYEITKLSPLMSRLLYYVVPAHRDRTAALTEDLRRLGAVAQRNVAHP